MLEDETHRSGFGTYSLTGDQGVTAIETAVEIGYRHLDTAHLYDNEDEVGEAIVRTDVDREELFVATKVAHFEEPEKTPQYVRNTVRESFDRLGIDTIDLLYHHWPRRREDVETVLPVIEEFVEAGDVRNLGVRTSAPRPRNGSAGRWNPTTSRGSRTRFPWRTPTRWPTSAGRPTYRC